MRGRRRPGLNFAHYPATVTQVVAIEPEPTLREHAVVAARAAPVPIEVRDGTADALPVEDTSCDAVVLSLVMCTVPDPAVALAEARRVLRPGGQVRFYEHVRSAHRVVAGAEDLVAPVWARFAGGCHPNRDAGGSSDLRRVRRVGRTPVRVQPAARHSAHRARPRAGGVLLTPTL